jgi:hypothetical protein
MAAAALVNRQLHDRSYKPPDPRKRAWHYGKAELRELLDFIYGSEPLAEEEKIK